ncbi:MAG TPA: nuclease-related domain-containing protein, partial [Bacillota bacterium]|nr:nuclease-related domain-containing protein [Bacillota bacterium]
ISQGVIHLLDIKNYQGDYYLESDKLFSVTTGSEFKNPVIQLKRSETLFRQLLQNLKQSYLVEALVVFINPEFTLYHSPMDQPIILPSQVNRFLNGLNKTPSKLNDRHNKIAQNLISLHQENNPFSIIPEFNYDQLRKGVTCTKCASFSLIVQGKTCICKECGHKELVSTAVIRSSKEFQLLFPTQKITANSIHEWCRIVESKKRIGSILGNHYKIVGVHQWSFYE